MRDSSLPILIFGTAGASKEAYYCVKDINKAKSANLFNVIGFVAKEDSDIGVVICDSIKAVTTDSKIKEYINEFEQLGLIIPLGDTELKRKIYDSMQEYHTRLVFPNIIHPSVIVDEESLNMGVGNIIMAGNVLACDLDLGDFNLINRCCTTGHDVKIGSYNTINPMSVVSGNVEIGNCCLIGAGSILLQGLMVPDYVIIGAGAVLTRNAKKGETLVGIPAKNIKNHKD